MIVKTTATAKPGAPSDPDTEEWSGEGGWMSTSTAAEKLGYTRQRIHQLIVEGKIPAKRIGTGRYQIPVEWMRAHLKKTAPIRRRAKPDQT